MKKPVIITLFLSLFLVFAGCDSTTTDGHTNVDSVAAADSIAWSHSLESLLQIPNEQELRTRFGKDAVKFDTIWGAEGFFTMGTVLKTEPESRIEITWSNEETKTGIVSVTQVSDSDWYGDTIPSGKWKSATGVLLGLSIEQLEKVNNRPFTFSGFGWDYAGSVIDWKKGALEGKGIAVQLAEGPTDEDLSDSEATSVLGDVLLQSDNPTARKFHPRVWSI